jgi:hypothetical protein
MVSELGNVVVYEENGIIKENPVFATVFGKEWYQSIRFTQLGVEVVVDIRAGA